MLRVEYVYWLCGLLLGACALVELRRRRFAHAAFWGLLAPCFIGGDAVEAAYVSGNALPAQLVGAIVIALALTAASGKLQRRAQPATDQARRDAGAARLGNRLFLPVLIIPIGTLLFLVLKRWLRVGDVTLFDERQATITALGLACVIAAAAALRLTRARPAAAIGETARLLDALSWAALLPMLLATLGGVFAATHVGEAIAHLSAIAISTESRSACLVAFALGMVAFTVIMGNAFAAFPVMMGGIGLPLLVGQHHADPAALGALGMLTGYCGTLLTPMAANFNVVPVALLELRDQYAVIRAQWPTAACLLVINLILMYFCAFR
jgi:uncharacterized membrane protein